MMKFRNHNHSLTANKAGAIAYKQSDEYAFVCLLVTTFLKDKFYETASEQLNRLQEYARTLDSMFLLKAAYYARHEHGIRSATHVVAGELVNRLKNAENGYKYLASLMRRPDDLLEIVSYYRSVNGKKGIPAILRKACAYALTKFDQYQIAKYKAGNSHFKMVDLFNLVHPKPNEYNQDIYHNLIHGTLPQADTWEARLSAAGSDVEKKKEAWTDLIRSRKIGYFALLRNLRNILEMVPQLAPEVVATLQNRELIKKSLVLPFRFQTALEQISSIPGNETHQVMQAVNNAAEISLDNTPSFDGKTLVAIDCSGSMFGYKNFIKTAALFGASLFKKNDADILLFDDKSRYLNIDKRIPLMPLAESIVDVARQNFCGLTNFDTIFSNRPYDRLIILSDMQSWVTGRPPYYEDYCKSIGKHPILHTFDLAGYGSMQFKEKDAYVYAGFSDKVLDIMKLVEQDQDALINEIKNIDPLK